MRNESIGAHDLAQSISDLAAHARSAQYRLVEYFLELALVEAKREATDLPTWWHYGRRS